MCERNSIIVVLRNKSGASLIFVLAIMLLLMAISISVLTAAATGSGAGINKQITNQYELYSDSIHAAIKNSLLYESRNDYNKDVSASAGTTYAPTTIGGQIIAAAYVNYINHNGNPEFDLHLSPVLNGSSLPSDVTVNVRPSVTSTVNDNYLVNAVVKVKVNLEGGGKNMLSVAEYRLRDVVLAPGYVGSVGLDRLIKNYGLWEFISYETVDK